MKKGLVLLTALLVALSAVPVAASEPAPVYTKAKKDYAGWPHLLHAMYYVRLPENLTVSEEDEETNTYQYTTTGNDILFIRFIDVPEGLETFYTEGMMAFHSEFDNNDDYVSVSKEEIYHDNENATLYTYRYSDSDGRVYVYSLFDVELSLLLDIVYADGQYHEEPPEVLSYTIDHTEKLDVNDKDVQAFLGSMMFSGRN